MFIIAGALAPAGDAVNILTSVPTDDATGEILSNCSLGSSGGTGDGIETVKLDAGLECALTMG